MTSESWAKEWLGEYICNVQITRDPDEFEYTFANYLTNVVECDINMLRASMMGSVLYHGETWLVVLIDDRGC